MMKKIRTKRMREIYEIICSFERGEQVSEENISKAVNIMKQDQKSLYDWILESDEVLNFALDAEILDCGDCIALIRVLASDDPWKPGPIRTYMKEHFSQKIIFEAIKKWEEAEIMKREGEQKGKQLLEYKELKRQEMLVRMPWAMNIGLEYVDLSIRSYNMLKRRGINYLIELVGMTEDELLRVCSRSRKTTTEIMDKVENFTGEGISDYEKYHNA